MANPFVHIELMATDVAKAKAFYGKLFDWKLEDMPMPDMTYTMIKVGEGTGGGLDEKFRCRTDRRCGCPMWMSMICGCDRQGEVARRHRAEGERGRYGSRLLQHHHRSDRRFPRACGSRKEIKSVCYGGIFVQS